MRVQVRVLLVALVVGAVVLVASAPAASAAGFGIEKFFAGNCKASAEKCGEGAKEADTEEAEKEGFTQAGGFVPYGVTDFKVKAIEAKPGLFVPAESIKNLRVDVGPGVVTNPQDVEMCSIKNFTGTQVAEGVFTEPVCTESTIIGKQEVLTVLEISKGVFADVPLSGNVYNLEQLSGQGATYGVALELGGGLVVHSIIQGSVEFNTDYHDYFVINNISPGLLESRLVFYGDENPETKEKDAFIRNPTKCVEPGPETTTTVTAESYAGVMASKSYEDPIGTVGCKGLKFEPVFSLTPETALSDQPDGVTAELTDTHPSSGVDTADLESIAVKMPEGMTMNPSAAAGLQACTPKQAGFTSETRTLAIQKLTPSGCPSRSKIGTVSLNVPTLPEGALQGSMYLGQEENKATGQAEPITESPYTIFLDARSSRYGIRVLLKGKVKPNETTGQLTTTFSENPQAPFNDVSVHFDGGAFAPIANPLSCGTGKTAVSMLSFAGPSLASESAFTTEGCTSTFAPTQSAFSLPNAAGAESDFVFNLTRPEGQQYVEKVSTTLPAGLVGKIPSVTQCSEAQANATQELGGGCPAASQIGTVQVTAGSGQPYTFNGKVYLTGPFDGAPYGLAFKVPVEAGPFKFTEEVTRATINVNPTSARVIVTAKLPTIKAGIPIRMRSLTVDIDRPNYIINPTSCAVLATESTVISTLGSTAAVPSAFQVENCGSLAFKPTFTASTSGKLTGNQPKIKVNGASLVTTITQPAGQANIRSVLVQLPRQLPSRLSTLQKACVAKTFEANPFSCNKESMVGTVTAVTPVLPSVMKGPAILVSHAGEAFPSLELVLEANDVRVIVEGKTHIKNGITTTYFETTPDVPVSSITVNLPLGQYSALTQERLTTNLCTAKLVMPTTITAQNGVVLKQNTIIAPGECAVQIVKQRVSANTLYLTVQTYAAGRVTVSGSGLVSTRKTLSAASKALTLKVPLTSAGRSRSRPFKVKVRVGFVPKQKGAKSSSNSVTVKF